ncbi:PucR family transcriptional regulator [Fusibacter sp. JL298sf-3]
MGVTMRELAQKIEGNLEYKAFIHVSNTEINKIKFLLEGQKEFFEDHLYIGDLELLSTLSATELTGNFVFFVEAYVDFEDWKYPGINVLVVKGKSKLYEVSNLINEVFTDAMTLSAFKQYTSLQQLADHGEHLFNNPVIIVDSSFRVIAHSNRDRIEDAVWKLNVQRGYCSYEFIAYVRTMDDMKNSKNNSVPFPLKCYKSPYDRYASKVFLEGKLVGYILVLLQNKGLSESDKNMLYEIAGLSGACFKALLSHKNMLYIEHENFLMDLLDKRISSQEVLDEKIKIHNEFLKSKYVVICFDLTDFKVGTKKNDFLAESINHLFYRRHIYYENYIVLLYDYDHWLDSDRLNEINDFAELNNIVIGISDEFVDLTRASAYYRQAKQTVLSKKRYKLKSSCLRYKQISYLALALDFEEKGGDTYCYTHPSLEKLKAYDDVNGTEFYLTLYTYLLNDQNAVLTGKDLFIHRNTVKYRIERIEEIADVCLNDPYERINLLVSYTLKGFLL